MNKFEQKKEHLVGVLSEYILTNGAANVSLKKLALHANTSDRMLLHYFENKQELIALVMIKLTSKLIALLQEHVQPMKFSDFISLTSTLVYNDTVKPYTNLAMELAFHKTDGEEYYNKIAYKIFNMFYDWIDASIVEEDSQLKLHQVSLAFVILEGLVVLDQVGLTEKIKLNTNILSL